MAVDLYPFVKRLHIVTKRLDTPTLGSVMNHAQLQVIEEVSRAMTERRPTRLIVLKARQMGLSTAIEAILFTLAFMVHRLKVMIISHEKDSAEHILSMTQNYWDTFDFNQLYTPKNKSVAHLSWLETKSALRIATAKNAAAGRSRTLQALHGSEVAFWDNAETLMTGLVQSIPQSWLSFIFLESTANGVGGYFHKMWEEAVEGDNGYTPMFFPWWDFPEYKGSFLGLKPIVGRLDEEERVLRKILVKKFGTELADDLLSWRRYALRELCQGDVLKFHQEYPSTSEEAFISTGTNVFPLPKLNAVYDPMDGDVGRLVEEGNKVRFQPDPDGPLKVYLHPSSNLDWGKYVVVGDPTRTTHGDYACIQVVHRRTWEQVAVFRMRCDPVTFGGHIAILGRYYNTALANCEIEGPGYATIARLLTMNYPYVWENQLAYRYADYSGNKYGWSSTWKTKAEAIGNLIKVVVDGDILIHDSMTFHEMKNYVTDSTGFKNANDAEHDDTVTSLAIAITTILYEAPGLPAYIPGDPEFAKKASSMFKVDRDEETGLYIPRVADIIDQQTDSPPDLDPDFFGDG